MKTDEELYFEYLHGDNNALDELLVRHKNGIIWFVYGFVKNMEDAEDLMMDTFALLISKKVRFRNDSSFKTWLYGIGRNLTRNYLRKNKAMPLEEIELIDFDLNSTGPEEEYIIKESNEALYKAISLMREEYMTVLYLSFFEQMDISMIAKIMKKNTRQVYNIMARAKKQLREVLDESVSV